jgi:glutathione S-transferase
MLKIYGSDLSGPSNKVRMTANALGLKYEYIPISIRNGENRTPEFLNMNPAGKIPVINDDGFILFESGAIIRYLAEKAGSSLYPKDRKERAMIDQWMDFIALHVGTSVSKVSYNRIFAPMRQVAVDEAAVVDGLKSLGQFLPVIDRQISKEKYVAGAELSLADISLLTVLDPADVAGIDLSAYPHVVTWRAALMKKDFYTKCHSSFKDAFEAFAQKSKTGR